MRVPFAISLDPNESVILTGPTTKVIKHGPGWVRIPAFTSAKKIDKIILDAEHYLIITHFTKDEVHKDIIEHIAGPAIYEQDDALATVSGPHKKVELSATEYVICTNPKKDGKRKTIKGPCLFMPEPYDQMSATQQMISLTINQYMLVTDIKTGHITCVPGPENYACEPFEKAGNILSKIDLNNTQYLFVTDTLTGKQKVEIGPQQFVPGPYDTPSGIKSMISLANNQYVYVNDKASGEWRLVKGPRTFHLTPFEIASEIKNVLSLNMLQWVKLVDQNSGKIRIVKGPDTVTLSPYESIIKEGDKDIRNAYTVDANNCVHVKDVESGTEQLITAPQKYIPEAPNIQVVCVQELIKLAPYECMILIDRQSKMIFNFGKDSVGFFIPPFCSIYSQLWSTNRDRKVKNNLKVERFDLRFHDMDFEFTVRSGDNVEILLVVNIYWSIIDVEKMVRSTSDPPQDICNHVRSEIISFASKLSTKELMEQPASEIIKQIHDDDHDFYKARGVSVSRINILEKRCADPAVDKTYKSIIDQKIARVSNLEQQHGENDREIARINGLTKIEVQTNDLLRQELVNLSLKTKTTGETEGGKIKSFFDGLGDMPLDQKMQIFLQIERTKRIELVVKNVPTLYLNPEEVDFHLDVVRLEEQSSAGQPAQSEKSKGTRPSIAVNLNKDEKQK
jgi:hypothetical protein